MPGREHTPNEINIQGDVAYMVLTNRAGFPVAVTLLDAADVPLVRSHRRRWGAHWEESTQSYYARGAMPLPGGGKKTLGLHQFLIGALPGMETDHYNHNTLDNRRKNLRPCTTKENQLNRRGPNRQWQEPKPRPRPRRLYYVWQNKQGKWRGYVEQGGRRHYFSGYTTRDEAEKEGERLHRELAA